jgi:hypothetical protein
MRLFGYKLHRVGKEVNVDNRANVDNTIINQLLYSLGVKFTKYDTNRTTYIEQGYNANADVFAVVNQKATEANRIPYCIKVIKDETQKNKFLQAKNVTRDGIDSRSLIKNIQLETKAFEDKDLPMPIDMPNPNCSWGDFIALYTVFINCVGEFYAYKVFPEHGVNSGVPMQYYVLPAHLIEIVLKDNVDLLSSEDPIAYYLMTQGDTRVKIMPENMMHIKLPNPNFDLAGSHLYGMSRLRSALDNIQSSNEATALNAKTLANGGVFGFMSTKEPLTETQAAALKERLVEMDNNTKRLSNIAGSSKEVVFTRISLTADELKVFDYLDYDQKQICNVLIWDNKLLNNDAGAKYDNYKFAIRRAITTGVIPDLRLLETALNADFIKHKGYQNTVFYFDETQLPEMQEDLGKLIEGLSTALKDGVIHRNEYRLAINYAASDEADMEVFTVSENVQTLSDAIMGIDDMNIDNNNTE